MKTRIIVLALFSIVVLSSCQKEITIKEETKTEIPVQPTWELDSSGVGTAQEVSD
ncbi:MAG: hypothetical protein ACXWCZ_13185 [Flavisolibacter sp.]